MWHILQKVGAREDAVRTGSKLADLHTDYVRENNSIALYEKVKSEYDSFISDMKKEPADVIIGSAYEIVKKDDITLYCQEFTPDLTEKQQEHTAPKAEKLPVPEQQQEQAVKPKHKSR